LQRLNADNEVFGHPTPSVNCGRAGYPAGEGPRDGADQLTPWSALRLLAWDRRSRRNARSWRRGPRAPARRSFETRAAPHRRMYAARDRHPHDNSAGHGRIRETTRSQAPSTSYRTTTTIALATRPLKGLGVSFRIDSQLELELRRSHIRHPRSNC